MSRNLVLKILYPHIDDPRAAINFALDKIGLHSARCDFLETWRDGAWDEIEAAYPEYLEAIA